MYVPTDISITGPQLVKLWRGMPVQLTKDSLKNPNSRVLLHPMMAKKVESARKKGTGIRVCCTQDEIMKTGPMQKCGSGRMSGTGWFSDAWNWLKQKVPQVASYLYENVPKAATWVKENIIDTPLYQEKLRPKVEGKILDTLSGLPYADTTRDIAQAGFDYSGIGVKKGKKKGGAICQARQKKPTGGSFKPTGY